jgi:hypothetical protein
MPRNRTRRSTSPKRSRTRQSTSPKRSRTPRSHSLKRVFDGDLEIRKGSKGRVGTTTYKSAKWGNGRKVVILFAAEKAFRVRAVDDDQLPCMDRLGFHAKTGRVLSTSARHEGTYVRKGHFVPDEPPRFEDVEANKWHNDTSGLLDKTSKMTKEQAKKWCETGYPRSKK